ncbi:MAG: sporulation protein [Clostridia bacterium]|nr:sporulation protein [Clostridia bacterium]
MEREQEKNALNPEQAHTLTLNDRRQAALTGVSEVIAFDDNQVMLATAQGDIALTGEGLHVTKLMLESGQLTVEGRIDSIFYSQRKRRRGLFHRGDT